MAVYKVPQDVEAEDKLIGPFSFRQFIYLLIALISIALGWGLSRFFLPLANIPLPLVILFGALALPLRKDQPMEIYLTAVVSFYLKPRKRLWQPDGIQSLVEVTAPKIVEVKRSKDLSQTEAQQRLSYLADIVDTGGWAVRGVGMPVPDSAMQNDVYYAAQQTEDILDKESGVARSFDSMIDQADNQRHQEMLNRMHKQPATTQPQQPQLTVPPILDPYAALTPTSSNAADPQLTYNPYPDNIHQSVVSPLGAAPPPSVTQQSQITPPNPQPATSEKPVSPDIINLANNSDLSIETIAHEANRIHQKEEEGEVVISLR
jgi:hypothetical protein